MPSSLDKELLSKYKGGQGKSCSCLCGNRGEVEDYLHARDNYGNTPIILACVRTIDNYKQEVEQNNIIEMLVKHRPYNIPIHVLGYNSRTKVSMLHWCASNGMGDAFGHLRKASTDIPEKISLAKLIMKKNILKEFFKIQLTLKEK